MTASTFFAARGTIETIESGDRLMPKFDADGLIVCVTTHAETGAVLMVAWMNAEALAKTIETGEAHYWSRSRQELWRKGATSGATQKVVEMRVDCDQDAVLIKVRTGSAGTTCHVGHATCFFRTVPLGKVPSADLRLETAPE